MPYPMQAQLSTFRWANLSSAAANPTNGDAFNPGTDPVFWIAPVSPSGMLTTGILLMLRASPTSPATAGVGGFIVTPWFLDQNSNSWASGATFNADYGQLFTTFDFDAIPIYFTFANAAVAGSILVGISEQ